MNIYENPTDFLSFDTSRVANDEPLGTIRKLHLQLPLIRGSHHPRCRGLCTEAGVKVADLFLLWFLWRMLEASFCTEQILREEPT